MRRSTILAVCGSAVLSGAAIALAWGDVLTTEPAASSQPPAAPASPAPPPAQPVKNGKPSREPPAFTHEREAAALTFVGAHHPELVDLLGTLKKSNKAEYQRAIRELFRQSERLASIQEKNPRRYDFELQDWKLNSRIQMLVARLTMSHDPAVEDKLRALVLEQMELRKQQLLEDRQRLAARLAEADEQLASMDREQSERVEKRLRELLGGAKKPKSKPKE